jgi:hypothetical protein
MLHKHLILREAEQIVLSLGFAGFRDFETALPESSLTLQKVQKELHVLHLLGVPAANVKTSSKKVTKKQTKDKTKISNVLRAAVGLTLQSKRASGCKRRKSKDAESSYTLAVAKPVQDIIDQPSELVAEHWYRRKYNQEPPHLDRFYTGDVPLTDEVRAVFKQEQDEEDERKAILLQQEKDAKSVKERQLQLQDNMKSGSTVVTAAYFFGDVEPDCLQINGDTVARIVNT